MAIWCRSRARLLRSFASESRIPKDYVAVPSLADPPVVGAVKRWYFRGPRQEADAIAASCRDLIDAGVPGSEIAVLLSNSVQLERIVCESLAARGVPVDLTHEPRFADGIPGRTASGLLRLIVNESDLVALRTLIGIQDGVGSTTCNEIAAWTIARGLRYHDLRCWHDLTGLSSRAQRAVDGSRRAMRRIEHLKSASDLRDACPDLRQAILTLTGEAAAESWTEFAANLPRGITVEEASQLLSSPTRREARLVARAIHMRLGLPHDDGDDSLVRVTTLHGSKGLTFDVVFIPGLEEGMLPSGHDMPFPGLVQQAARLLFVGITRARLMVVLSLAGNRVVNGRLVRRAPSQFIGSLSGRFEQRENGLDLDDVALVSEARNARLH